MLTVAAYPVFQDKKAPRPCMRSRSFSSVDAEMLTLCSSRCPPVRGMSRRTDRSQNEGGIDIIILVASASTGSTPVVVVWPVVRYGFGVSEIDKHDIG